MALVKHKKRQATSVRTSRARKIFYAAFGIAAVAWIIYGVTNFWSTSTRLAAAENHAYLVELRGRLDSLPAPDQLQVGVTAGNAEVVIAAYHKEGEELAHPTLVDGSLFQHGPSALALSQLDNQSRSTLEEFGTQLVSIADVVEATKKLLNYDPRIDLTPVMNGNESSSNERIDRTAEGLLATHNALSKIDTSLSRDVARRIKPLINQAKGITRANTEEWYATVATAQRQITTLLNDDFVSYRANNTQSLDKLSENYLDLTKRH